VTSTPPAGITTRFCVSANPANIVETFHRPTLVPMEKADPSVLIRRVLQRWERRRIIPPLVKSVYCTAMRQRIIGIAEVYMPPTNDGPEEERWPWRCRVKPHLMLATIEGAPSRNVLTEAQTEEGSFAWGSVRSRT